MFVGQAGCVNKLQNRFLGPFVVSRCDNDIRFVERPINGRKVTLHRHVSGLKPFKSIEIENREGGEGEQQEEGKAHESEMRVRIAVILVMVASLPVRSLNFVEAPLVSGRQNAGGRKSQDDDPSSRTLLPEPVRSSPPVPCTGKRIGPGGRTVGESISSTDI